MIVTFSLGEVAVAVLVILVLPKVELNEGPFCRELTLSSQSLFNLYPVSGLDRLINTALALHFVIQFWLPASVIFIFPSPLKTGSAV